MWDVTPDCKVRRDLVIAGGSGWWVSPSFSSSVNEGVGDDEHNDDDEDDEDDENGGAGEGDEGDEDDKGNKGDEEDEGDDDEEDNEYDEDDGADEADEADEDDGDDEDDGSDECAENNEDEADEDDEGAVPVVLLLYPSSMRFPFLIAFSREIVLSWGSTSSFPLSSSTPSCMSASCDIPSSACCPDCLSSTPYGLIYIDESYIVGRFTSPNSGFTKSKIAVFSCSALSDDVENSMHKFASIFRLSIVSVDSVLWVPDTSSHCLLAVIRQPPPSLSVP